MARTFIEVIAQPTSNRPEDYNDFPGVTVDNCTTYIQQGTSDLFGDLLLSRIINGDGVNGEVVGFYPSTETIEGEAGSVSKIFDYLNAGGSNVKYTKLTFTTSLDSLSENTLFGGTSASPYWQQTHIFKIYWGKYILYKSIIGELNSASSVIQYHLYHKEHFKLINNLYGVTGDYKTSLQLNINLDTKKIIGLPYQALNFAVGEGSPDELGNSRARTFNWTIETDDFATTVTAPTPQETTEEVSGTKISQLPSTTTLQDDDLLVISRDEGSDGSFDTSYNTSLSNLAAKINEGMNEEGGQLPRFVPLNLPLLTSSITASDPSLEPIITAQLVYNEGQKAYVNQFFGFGSENVVTNTSTISVHKIVFLDLVGIIPPEAKYIQCKLDDVQTGTDIEWVVESESIGEIYTTSSGTRFASPGIEYRLTRGNSGRVTNYVNRFAIERGLDSFIVQDPNNVNGSGPTLQPDRLNYQPYTDIIVRRNSAYTNSLTSVTLHPLTIEGYYI